MARVKILPRLNKKTLRYPADAEEIPKSERSHRRIRVALMIAVLAVVFFAIQPILTRNTTRSPIGSGTMAVTPCDRLAASPKIHSDGPQVLISRKWAWKPHTKRALRH